MRPTITFQTDDWGNAGIHQLELAWNGHRLSITITDTEIKVMSDRELQVRHHQTDPCAAINVVTVTSPEIPR